MKKHQKIEYGFDYIKCSYVRLDGNIKNKNN